MFSHKNFSTYLALITWGSMAFTAQPNFSSFVVHFFVSPLMLAGIIALAHTEGRGN